MRSCKISNRFPALCSLLNHSEFDRDADQANKLTRDEFKTALDENAFLNTPLIELLCGAVIPEWRSPEAEQLESDIRRIVETLGIERAHAAFSEKLVVPDGKTLEDVRYEISVPHMSAGRKG